MPLMGPFRRSGSDESGDLKRALSTNGLLKGERANRGPESLLREKPVGKPRNRHLHYHWGKMSWHRIRFTKSQIKAGYLRALKTEFKRLWNLVGAPKDMALFAGSPHEKKDEQCFYLSPGCLPWAERLVSLHFGSPCDKPPKTEVRPKLLVGHPEATGLIE